LTYRGRLLAARLFAVEILREAGPKVLNPREAALRLECGLGCELPLEGALMICECGTVYHKSPCLDQLAKTNPLMKCSSVSCPGRKRGVPLLEIVKPLL
jgi:hypothetical protein